VPTSSRRKRCRAVLIVAHDRREAPDDSAVMRAATTSRTSRCGTTRRRAGSRRARSSALQPPVARQRARAAQRDRSRPRCSRRAKKCRPTRSSSWQHVITPAARAMLGPTPRGLGPAGRALARGSREPRRAPDRRGAQPQPAAGAGRWRSAAVAPSSPRCTRGRPDWLRASRARLPMVGSYADSMAPSEVARARALRARAACVGTAPPQRLAARGRSPRSRAARSGHSGQPQRRRARAALSDRHHRGGGREAAHPSHARGDRRQQAEGRARAGISRRCLYNKPRELPISHGRRRTKKRTTRSRLPAATVVGRPPERQGVKTGAKGG